MIHAANSFSVVSTGLEKTNILVHCCILTIWNCEGISSVAALFNQKNIPVLPSPYLKLPYTVRLAIFFKFGSFGLSNDRNGISNEKKINIGGEMVVLRFGRK